jgi:hypothetical protein
MISQAPSLTQAILQRLHLSLLSVHLSFLVLLAVTVTPAGSQTLLVRFGATPAENSFGLSGWNTAIQSPALHHTADGPGGLAAAADADEYSDFQGVRGVSRSFTPGEGILVTWYNRSEEVIRFTARVSFTDADQPDGGVVHGRWYTMRRADFYRETWTEIQPHGTAQTLFAIRDHGVHTTDSNYSLVNVNLAIEWGMNDRKQHLICSRIELLDNIDITAPAAPANVRTTGISSSRCTLAWDEPQDNTGVYDYLIYLDGEIEGYSRTPSFPCVNLEADTELRISVSARDVMLNEGPRSAELHTRTLPFPRSEALLNPSGLRYLGAFRLPDAFSWGGEALAYYVDGDGGPSGSGAADGFPGSLLVSNVNQQEHGHIGEINIPAPAIVTTGSIEDLPLATLLHAPVNIRPSAIDNWDYVDIWRCGMEYLADEQRLYSSWGIHYSVTGEKHANISCTAISDLATGTRHGPWYVGDPDDPPNDAQQGDYLFAVPDSWASTHVGGRRLVVGRARDGGLSGLGPTLYAFSPAGMQPPAANTAMEFTTLLEYGPVAGSDNYHYPNAIDGYNHRDDWRGACWLAAGTQAAVAFIGRKAHGDNWYGFHGERMPLNWIVADVPMPAFYDTDPDGKGWRAHRQQPMILLYDPTDIAEIATGRRASYEAQPYGAIRLDEQRFFGGMREIFSTTFDALHQLLYITEFVREADGAPVIHVYSVEEIALDVAQDVLSPADAAWLINSPNPFSTNTSITCYNPRAGHITVRIHDLLGREIATLADGHHSSGVHAFHFDARSHKLPSGAYLAILLSGNSVLARTMLLTQ